MSDSTGFGTGGTSTIYTVGSGSSGCLPTTPSKADFYMYADGGAPSQCGAYPISWDGGVNGGVKIYGIIPGGQSFDLGAPSIGTGFDWTTNVREGTQMMFLAVGANNENGGSTDITTVSGGSSGCINAQSPSSTAGPAAGSVSTPAQSATGTGPASNPSQTGSVPGTTGNAGTSNPTATVTNPGGTATATGSPSTQTSNPNPNDPTQTGNPDPNNPSQTGNPNPNDPSHTGNNPNNPTQTTGGSGGGTVTGDPHLPVATHNSLDNPRRLNLAAIIGGTLGGVALILILLLIWLLCARRRRERNHEDHERLITQRRTDLLADSIPIMHSRNESYDADWFRAEPFVPPMSADEFAHRTGGTIREQADYHDEGNGQSGSSLGHGAVTNSSAAAAMYGALARTPSRSTSGHGHRSSHSHSRSLSHSHNVSHSPAHSRQASSHGHSRSFSNPYSFSFTPNSGVSGRRDTTPLTPPTPMSTADPFANPVSRPPPSSWQNHASTSANVVPRSRPSNDINEPTVEGKSGEEEASHELGQEGDIVDIPPSYDSLRRSGPRVMNP